MKPKVDIQLIGWQFLLPRKLMHPDRGWVAS
jgi:hypothetical protein